MSSINKTIFLQGGSALLTVVLIFTSIKVVGLSYQSRLVYYEIETAYQDELKLQILQGQLRIEHGTWVAPAEIEARARDEIGLRPPEPAQQYSLADLVTH